MARSDDPPDKAGPELDERFDRLRDGLGRYARDRADALRGEIDGLVAARKRAAADTLTDLSDALRHSSDFLGTRGHRALADLGNSGADHIEATARSIRGRALGALIDDLRRAVRRDPDLTFAGAALLGFLAIRLARSGGHGAAGSRDRSAPRRVLH